MKIILVATDQKGKNIGFISDSLRIYSLEEISRLILSGKIDAHIVQGRHGSYIRSTSNNTEEDNLDAISISGRDIISYVQQVSNSGGISPINSYLESFLASLKEVKTLKPVGQGRVPVSSIKRIFKRHVSLLRTVSKEFEIDVYLFGAILIDELARMHPFEQIIDFLGGRVIGKNVSIGIMQVTLDTTNQLIKEGLYNPNPDDRGLPFKGTLSNENRAHLYKYLIQPKHNVRFAAACIRDLINQWSKIIDISQRSEIIATLYHLQYRKPNLRPLADKRGDQIATEFYRLSKKWLA